jgi:tryptophanyl-tRNA synthetase
MFSIFGLKRNVLNILSGAIAATATLSLSAHFLVTNAEAARKPNILFVIMDDAGIDQFSAFGYGGLNPPLTPVINKIADQGIKFRNTWSMPECSNGRMALLTGRYPFRTNVNQAIAEKDLATYGFLGYPLLQSADILLYRPAWVPVGEDQVAHVEITREIARRFNHIFGQETGFEAKAEKAVAGLGGRQSSLYRELRRKFQEGGDTEALEKARGIVQANTRITVADRERLLGYLEGTSVAILPEPQVMLTPTPKLPGLDGRKMSKSYGNTIGLREDPDAVTQKLKTMQTDPARARRTDPGEPERCPVWSLHQVYSDEATHRWVEAGCRSASIGCLECKKPLIDRLVEDTTAMRKRAQEFEENPELVRNILAEGAEKAREAARETLDEVRRAMHLRGD